MHNLVKYITMHVQQKKALDKKTLVQLMTMPCRGYTGEPFRFFVQKKQIEHQNRP